MKWIRKGWMTLVFAAGVLVVLAVVLGDRPQRETPVPFICRYTFVSPLVSEETAAGMAEADQEFHSNTKFVGFDAADPAGQAKAIREAVYANVDGILVEGGRPSRDVENAVEFARKSGIPVLTLLSDLPYTDRNRFVGPDNRAAGERAGDDLAEATEGNAVIGVIVGERNNPAQADRLEGLSSAAKKYGMEIADVIECHSDRIEVQSLLTDLLKKYPEINAVCCLDEKVSDEIGEKIREREQKGTPVKTVVFGMSESIRKYLEHGEYASAIVVDYREMGYRSIEALREIAGCPNAKGKNVVIPFLSTADGSEIEGAWSGGNGDVKWEIR